MRRFGFGLVEILVVLGILLVLAVIFFPVFASTAHHGPNINTCLNNQRQIAIAIQMYIEDNNDTFFPDAKTEVWAIYLRPYNERSIYDCYRVRGPGTNGRPEYGFNANLYGRTGGSVARPAELLLTAELAPHAMHGSFTLTSTDPTAVTYYGTAIDPRHGSTCAYSCADGHVAILTVKPAIPISDALKRDGITLEVAPAKGN